MPAINVELGVSVKGFKNTVDNLKKDTAKTIHQMVTGMRRTAQLGIALSTAFGGVIDQTYSLAIEAGLLGVELATGIAAATSANPYSLVKAGLQAGAIVSLILTINRLEAGQAEAARQTQGAVQMFRLLTF